MVFQNHVNTKCSWNWEQNLSLPFFSGRFFPACASHGALFSAHSNPKSPPLAHAAVSCFMVETHTPWDFLSSLLGFSSLVRVASGDWNSRLCLAFSSKGSKSHTSPAAPCCVLCLQHAGTLILLVCDGSGAFPPVFWHLQPQGQCWQWCFSSVTACKCLRREDTTHFVYALPSQLSTPCAASTGESLESKQLIIK